MIKDILRMKNLKHDVLDKDKQILKSEVLNKDTQVRSNPLTLCETESEELYNEMLSKADLVIDGIPIILER